MALGPAKLRLINPFFKSVHDPRSKTVMGGMLAITVLPAILLLYALWFANDFVSNRRGFQLSTTQEPATSAVGIRLDSTCSGVCPDTSSGQPDRGHQLICLAENGCWYTVAERTDGVQVPDKTCPPQSMLAQNTASAIKLNGIFSAENLADPATTPASIKTDTSGWMLDHDDGAQTLWVKSCVWAAQGQRLNGACVYSVEQPHDAMSITWIESSNQRGDSLGVALVSPRIHKIEETSGSLLFGGTYFGVEWNVMPLHYGAITLNMINIDTDNGNMRANGVSVHNEGTLSSIQQLSPAYGYVGTSGPWLGNINDPCFLLANGAMATATLAPAASAPRLVTMTLTPGASVVTQSYTSSNVVFAFLSSFGGMLSLTMLFLGALHTVMWKSCGSRSLCSPDPDAPAVVGAPVKKSGTGDVGETSSKV